MKPISTPADALVFLDFFARFVDEPQTQAQYAQLAAVIRDLTRRLEDQALAQERAEAAAIKGNE